MLYLPETNAVERRVGPESHYHMVLSCSSRTVANLHAQVPRRYPLVGSTPSRPVGKVSSLIYSGGRGRSEFPTTRGETDTIKYEGLLYCCVCSEHTAW